MTRFLWIVPTVPLFIILAVYLLVSRDRCQFDEA
jgi:hypothetical protein